MQMKGQKTSRLPGKEDARWGHGNEMGWAWNSVNCYIFEAR